MEFTGCKLEFKLNPQSPIIHFQPNEAGATVRATELKPKLDKFLIEQFKRENVSYKTWLAKEDDNTKAEALDYKVRIRTESPSYKVRVGTRDAYSIYFGNMGKNTVKKAGIISCPIVTIICFKSGLREQITKHIYDFFYVTNFGTMQSKGFGGFLIEGDVPSEEKLLKAFKNKGAKGIYRMDFKEAPISFGGVEPNYAISIKMFDRIKQFYSVMKSGQNFKGYSRSYLFEFMHKKFQIDNEKAWLKEKGISPNVEKKHKRDVYQENPRPRYVRAFFGKGEKAEYFKDKNLVNEEKVPVTINSNSKSIERIPSAIQFKVIGKSVYILGMEVPEILYDKEFIFDGKTKGNKLKTPSHEDFAKTGGEFPMKDFLDKYVDYYNGPCRGKLWDMKKSETVVKCE